MGRWIYYTFSINIKINFTKDLATQQCTRAKLYILNEFASQEGKYGYG